MLNDHPHSHREVRRVNSAPTKCICRDEQEIEPLNTDPETLFACEPRYCHCDGQEAPIPVQLFGCEKGGLPGCDGGPITCPGQPEPLDFEAILKSSLMNECVCGEEGPVCHETGEKPKCPGGEFASSEFGELPSFLRNCH